MKTSLVEKKRPMGERAFLGERLRQARERVGLSQTELARRIETGPNQIFRYENGQAEPSPSQLKRLARYLEVTSDYLLGLSDLASAPSLSAHEHQVLEALRRGQAQTLRHLLDKVLSADKPG